LERVTELRRAAQQKCDGAGVGEVGGKIVPPRKVVSVNPQYPEQLRLANVGGIVTMEALIGMDGNVQDVQVIESPHSDLERSAVEAVRGWQYTQTLLNCAPVEVRMRVTTNFRVQP
jgi:TonB family protein